MCTATSFFFAVYIKIQLFCSNTLASPTVFAHQSHQNITNLVCTATSFVFAGYDQPNPSRYNCFVLIPLLRQPFLFIKARKHNKSCVYRYTVLFCSLRSIEYIKIQLFCTYTLASPTVFAHQSYENITSLVYRHIVLFCSIRSIEYIKIQLFCTYTLASPTVFAHQSYENTASLVCAATPPFLFSVLQYFL